MTLLQLSTIVCYIFVCVQASPQLLFANRRDLRLVDAGRPRNNRTRLRANSTVLLSGLEDAVAVDFLYEDGLIFWTDVTLQRIRRASTASPSATATDAVRAGLAVPDGLACDWVGRKLYWTDSDTNRIEASELDGSLRTVLYWHDLDQPRAIALSPSKGYMYWSDWGESPKIERAGMDGSEKSRGILITTDIYWPNGLALDHKADRLFWTDAKLGFIHSCRASDGGDRQAVVSAGLPHPFAITLHAGALYWTDWQTRSIHTCQMDGKGKTRVVLDEIYSPMDIQVYNSARQPHCDNPCGTNNGGCSDLCLMSPFKPFYKCACPTGVRLLEDRKNCAAGAQQLLLLARCVDLRRISLDTDDHTDIVLPLTDIRHAIAIDYDPVDDLVYWTDDEAKVIRRASMDGSRDEIIVSDEVQLPDGIAIDPISRNLYWTDTGTNRIEVARLNGTSRRVLISENLDEPRAIAIDPIGGYMYWTDWSSSEPKIERAWLDGSNRVLLVNVSLGWPNGLALDRESALLYWSDAKTDKVEVASSVDGSGRRVLVSEQLPHVFGFSILGDYIYWTDWQRRCIERVHKVTGKDRSIVVEQLPDLMGLKAIDISKVTGTNQCAEDDGGCSHLCLQLPSGVRKCACPLGLELKSDGRTCVQPDAFLLFMRAADIRRLSLRQDGGATAAIPLGSGVRKATAIDFHITDSRIYWSDVSLKCISRAQLNGSAVQRVVSLGLQQPAGLAVDWLARNLYWTDTHHIEMARLDGSARRVVLWKDLDSLHNIVVDPPNGHLYWSSWGNKPRVERSSLDGKHRTVMLSKIGRANGLTLDLQDQLLYWTNLDANRIESVPLDGTRDRRVIQTGLPQPYGLTQYGTHIYWSDWNTNSIERADKMTGGNRTRLHGELDHIVDILVFHASRQTGWNSCHDSSNGGCAHLCIAHSAQHQSSSSHHCACATHYKLQQDGVSCLPPTSFLLFSQRSQIHRLPIGGAMEEEPDAVLPIAGVRNVRALSYDPVTRHVYWVDGRSKSVKRATDTGHNVTTFIHGPQHSQFVSPHSIVVDVPTRCLYWSDSQNNVVNVTRLDGRPVGVVIGGSNQRPRALALDSYSGLLFWVNAVSPPRIQRASLDGTARQTLFSTQLGSPVALTVDSGKLFWADTELRRIEVAGLDGGNRRVLVSSPQPVSLSVAGGRLYWVDREAQVLESCNIQTGGDRQRHLSRMSQLTSLTATIPPATPRHHPCSERNGGCEYLCVAGAGNTSRCSCPVGLQLSADEQTCAEPSTCAADHFTCGAAYCIPLTWRCDGYPDCSDESDEKGCSGCVGEKCESRGPTAPGCVDNGGLLCGVLCVSAMQRCDGHDDCEDGEDERDCRLPVPRSALSAPYTIAFVLGLFVILGTIVGGVLLCRRKGQGSGLAERDGTTVDLMLVKVPGMSGGVETSRTTSLNSAPHSGRPLLYDRNHVTGASSSCSTLAAAYPHETLNPPPSPVSTQRSRYPRHDDDDSTVSTTLLPSRRRHPRAPQPTPASTAWDDSDADKTYYDSDDGGGYPPPPCPSGIPSCPASPSTGRSFCNPYPPPPSPVGLSDC